MTAGNDHPRAILRLVLLAVWIALGLSVGFVAVSVAVAAVDGLRLWRVFRRFQLRTSAGVGDVLRRVAEIEARTAAAGDRARRLQQAQARLHDSLAVARTLAGAIGEVRTAVGRLTGLVPSK
jgi:hypothetical protein